MGLAGTGAVAIWHDIVPEGRDGFYAWHGLEHMPERVAIPGFQRGRRYVAIDADLEYFNLYEADSHDVVTGPAYQERLNDPTPWTVETVKHFRRVARSICRVEASEGPGQGGLVATLRYDVSPEAAVAHAEAVAEQILTRLCEEPQIAGAHLLIADREASAVDTAERKARGEANMIPSWIIVLEGWGDVGPFTDLCKTRVLTPLANEPGVTAAPDFGTYRLQATAVPPGQKPE